MRRTPQPRPEAAAAAAPPEAGGSALAKADNLLAVLWLLRSRRRLTAAQLAEALEVSARTVYRYIDALCASGVPIQAEAGPAGGYSLPEHFRGTPLVFAPLELVALFQAASFADAAGYPHSAALTAALAKVQRNLSPEQAAQVARHTAALAVALPPPQAAALRWLAPLEAAAAEGATLRLTYHKAAADAPEERVIDPYAVTFRGRRWYVVGWCHTRRALRDFRVDRIHALERTGGRFERPADFQVPAPGDGAEIHRRLAAGPLTTVRLAGEPWALDNACEHWYLRHCLVARRHREATFCVDPQGLDEVPYLLLGLGSHVRVLAPDDLRERVAAAAQALADHHRRHP